MGITTWYHNLALFQPASYKPWRHSLRITLGTGLPLLIGVLTGDVAATIFVALGGFLTAVTVRLDPYRERFLQIAISTSVGVLGCFLGPLVAGHGVMTLIMLVLVGLISGLISGYGMAFSTGSLNMLVLTVVTSSMPDVPGPWLLGLQFLSGALLVVVLLGIGAAFDRSLPERHMLVRLLQAVVDLARAAATIPSSGAPASRTNLEEKRRAVTTASTLANELLIEKRLHGRMRTRYTLHAAATLSLVNQLTMSIIAARASRASLLAAANRLEAIANAYEAGDLRPCSNDIADVEQDELLRLVARLATQIWSPSERTLQRKRVRGEPALPVFSMQPLRSLGRRLVLGREVIIAALRLSLCMGIAVLVGQLMYGSHSYWLPMTVAIVLKPDFGSVFVRGIHRSIGTLIGVGVTGLITVFVHNDFGLVACITLLCAFIPWAGLRSYAATVAFLTPVILLMLSLVVPDSTGSYVEQRVIDTILGVAIALVFGYLIWPRSQGAKISATFAGALNTVRDFLGAASGAVPQDDAELATFRQAMVDSEFAAYRSLADLRTQLQRLIAEPPPAGREAAAWFPAVAGAERLCDRITAYAEGRRQGDPPPDEVRATRALQSISWLAAGQRASDEGAAVLVSRTTDDPFGEVETELAWLCDYLATLSTTGTQPVVLD